MKANYNRCCQNFSQIIGGIFAYFLTIWSSVCKYVILGIVVFARFWVFLVLFGCTNCHFLTVYWYFLVVKCPYFFQKRQGGVRKTQDFFKISLDLFLFCLYLFLPHPIFAQFSRLSEDFDFSKFFAFFEYKNWDEVFAFTSPQFGLFLSRFFLAFVRH